MRSRIEELDKDIADCLDLMSRPRDWASMRELEGTLDAFRLSRSLERQRLVKKLKELGRDTSEFEWRPPAGSFFDWANKQANE